MSKKTDDKVVTSGGESENNAVVNQAIKNASKTTFKILLALVFAFCYLITILFFVSPKAGAKIFHFFGYNKAEEFCYYRIYEKSNSAADLYNLILFEQNVGENERELYYINVLLNREDYSDFCAKLDMASIDACKDIKLIPYVGNVNSYLINQKISSMYKLNISCLNELKNQLEKGNVLETSYATYVDLIRQNSSMSESQKQATYSEILTEQFVTLLDSRTSKLTATLEEYETTDCVLASKILHQYSLMRLYEAEYIAYKAVGNEDKANEFKDLWAEINAKAKVTLGITN